MNKRANKQKQAKINRINGIQGQGGYYSDKIVPFMQKVVPQGTFRAVGGKVGTHLGGVSGVPYMDKVGGGAGGYLGGKLSQILGFGDYTVRQNSLMDSGGKLSEGTEIPTFKSVGHETRICHREYIGDILTPASPLVFSNTSYKINAANPSLFPWLAPIAANYQQYRFNGLVLEFKSLSSDVTAGGALGAIIMATNYDAVDTVFSSKLTMENSEFAISCKPSLSQMHAVECDPQQVANNLYYCRDSTQGTGTADNRFYDLGNFQIATVGLPSVAGTVLGELWASYDVSLLKPEVASTTASGGQSILAVTSISNAVPFGTSPTSTGPVLATAAGNVLTFPFVGTYYLAYQWGGTVFAHPTIGGTATTTLKLSEFPRPGTLTNATVTYTVNVSVPNQTTILDFTTCTSTTALLTHVIATSIASLT